MQNTIIIPPIISKSTVYDHQDDQLSYYDDQQLESLSLRDLPITPSYSTTTVDHLPHHNTSVSHSRRSSTSSVSDPTSDFFFEFLINNDDDLITSTADDIIFHGRLLPFTPPPPPRPRRSLSLSSAAARLTRPQLTESPPSESLPTIRPSRSLNYRKLRRNRSITKPKTELLHRNPLNNSRCNSDKIPAKLPWYWLVFGLPGKVAVERELKDMKNRQFRRNTAPERVITGGRSCSSASWKFLSVLSCKSHATVDVTNTPPFHNSLM